MNLESAVSTEICNHGNSNLPLKLVESTSEANTVVVGDSIIQEPCCSKYREENVSEIEIDIPTTGDSKPISKKLARRLKWQERGREKRKFTRPEERKRKKAKLLEKRLKGEQVGPSRKKLKQAKMVDSHCKIRVVLDMSLDSYMDIRNIKRTYQQIQHSYSANRRAKNPMQLHLASFDGPSRKVFDSVDGSANWDLYLHTDHFEKLFPAESIVYLTSDSNDDLETLDDSKTYIIGGLIDHNHHKELCYNIGTPFFKLISVKNADENVVCLAVS